MINITFSDENFVISDNHLLNWISLFYQLVYYRVWCLGFQPMSALQFQIQALDLTVATLAFVSEPVAHPYIHVINIIT